MRRVLQTLALHASAGSLAILGAACGGTVRGSDDSSPTTQVTYGVTTPMPPNKQSTREDRLSAHEGRVLPNVRLRIIYAGTPDADRAPDQDEFLSWLVASEYWGTLGQYGVGNGTVLSSVTVPRALLAPAELVAPGGLIEIQDLDARVRVLVNGSATEDAFPGVAGADAYVIFLPDGLNVMISHRADYVSTTCVDERAYHAHDGTEPYAVIPPCAQGRGTVAVSHEIAEMVTDPVSARGWLSEGDVSKNGGEVADLCNHSVRVDGREVTQLWSNRDGECVPYHP